MEDFRLFRSEAGFVALPREGVELLLEMEGPAAHQGVGDPFRLESMQFRMPSEHKVQGRQFPGELQLVHRNRLGAAVTVAMLLEGLPRHKTVLYPKGCPDLYSRIESAVECKLAAFRTKLISGEDAVVRLRKFKSAHCVLGCYAARHKGVYSIMLDPEIINLSVKWGKTLQLCQIDTVISEWLKELVRRASDPQHAPSCGTWLGSALDGRCGASTLPLRELLRGPLPALRYDGSLTRMKTLQKDTGRFTFRLHAGADLGLSLDYEEDRPLIVKSIDPSGSVAAWNRGHPEQRVEVGDRIVAVDGRFAPVHELLAALLPNRDLEVTVDWTEVPECSSPLEWLVLASPLPVELPDLQKAMNMSSALPPLIGSRKALRSVPTLVEEAELSEVLKPEVAEAANHSGVARGSMDEVDLAALLPPDHDDLEAPLASALQSSAFAMLGAAFAVAGFIAWGLLSWPGQYEPDLVERTRQACWPLVRVHIAACAAAWASVPLLLVARALTKEANDDWQLPWASGLYISVAVLAQLLLELRYVETTGCARIRVPLLQALQLLAFDALAIVDLYLDLLFFCIAYISGSKLCWGALWAFLVGRLMGQWLLGALLAMTASDEALLHWQPRQMGLMHAVVLRQLLSMQREDEVRARCAWVALPLLKCALEDVPFLLLQVAFFGSHRVARPWVGLSAATSAASAVRGVYLTFQQAKEVSVSSDEVVAAVRAHLYRFNPRSEAARECPGTARAAVDGEEEQVPALDHE